MKKNDSELDIIGMVWSDKISFDEIKKKTKLNEKDVIKIMSKNLEKSIFVLWRKRASGRPSKHRKLTKFKFKPF